METFLVSIICTAILYLLIATYINVNGIKNDMLIHTTKHKTDMNTLHELIKDIMNHTNNPLPFSKPKKKSERIITEDHKNRIAEAQKKRWKKKREATEIGVNVAPSDRESEESLN